MHRCLLVPELINLICEEANTPSPKRAPTLLSLALTCRSFQEPCLDRLWYKIGTIDRLIRCMPSDLWSTEKGDERFPSRSVIFQRPITPADWPRFIVNARRVHHLVAPNTVYRSYPVIQETYQKLELSDHPKPLFPNLRSLDWSVYDDEMFPFIKLFFAPQLQRSSIYFGPSLLTRAPHFNALCTQCPSITYLDIAPTHPDWECATALSTGLQNLKHLRHLTVGEIDFETFIHLAKLPHLQHLDCSISTIMYTDGCIPSNILPIFPSLQELDIKTMRLSFTTYLINSMSCRSLKLINVFVTDAPPSWPNDFIKILAGKCSRNMLRRVTIGGDDYSYDRETCYSPSVDITPLFSYSGLTFLNIRDADVDDKTMLTLALALPRVTYLFLLARPTVGRRRTLQSVVYLAEHCRELKCLKISLDATRVPITGISNKSLIALKIIDSPISDPEGVANFLMNTFSRLMEFEGSYEEAYQLWYDVDSWLCPLMTARDAHLTDSDWEYINTGFGFQ